jgi:hypothetical protein
MAGFRPIASTNPFARLREWCWPGPQERFLRQPPNPSWKSMLLCESAFAVLFRNSPDSVTLLEEDKPEERAMTKQTYDATRDPRTGRPKHSLDAERAKASPASPDRDMKETRPGRDACAVRAISASEEQRQGAQATQSG